MALPPIVYPARAWTNQEIVLFHGTIDLFASSILAGIRVAKGKPYTDFGPGFYTTTIYDQAHHWAAQMAASRPGSAAAVIQIKIPRENLAALETLAFIHGNK